MEMSVSLTILFFTSCVEINSDSRCDLQICVPVGFNSEESTKSGTPRVFNYYSLLIKPQ